MKTRIATALFFAVAAASVQAATLRFHVYNLNHSKGDVFQYRWPGRDWTTADPFNSLYTYYGAPDNVIVSARIVNNGRVISSSVKATWRGNGGDADWFGNVHFYLYGSG